MTELRIQEVHERTRDELVVREVVTVEHTAPGIESVPPELLPAFNRLATTSVLVPGDETGPTRLVSKVGIFGGDQAAAELLYSPILCMEAASPIGWYGALIAARQTKADPDQCPYNQVHADPPYTKSDFDAVVELSFSRGYYASVERRFLAVEFPWDPGAVSNLFRNEEFKVMARESGKSEEEIDRMGGRTSLLILSEQEHSIYGKGIQSRLEIPVFLDYASSVILANELNRWELSGYDLPPLWGAWCSGDRSVTFVSFFPTQLCVPGLLHNLTAWAVVRHQRVREWLNFSNLVQ